MAEYCQLAYKELGDLKTLIKIAAPDKDIDECLERIGYHIRKITDYAHFESRKGYGGYSVEQLRELIKANDILVYTDLSEIDDIDEFLLSSMKNMDAAFVAMGYRSLYETPPKPKFPAKGKYNPFAPNDMAVAPPIAPIQWFDEEPEGV